jgi:hypothetical protein
MKILIFEDNLMWGPRLRQTVTSLGHEAVVIQKMPDEIPPAEAAIVNLGSEKMDAATLVPKLKEAGIYVIAHAGHKEKQLHQIGKDLGCDRLASNSELTYKLDQLLPKT